MASGWLGWDWGSVPAWVGTVLTGGSALIAALAFRRSVLDKEREQASKVAAWTSISYEPHEKHPQRTRRLHVHNSSDAPIFEVTAWAGSNEKKRLPDLQAHGAATFDLPAKPGARATVHETSARVNFWVVGMELRTVSEVVEEEPTRLEFRDALGRWWERDREGKLKPLRAHTVTGTTWEPPSKWWTR